MNRDEVTGVSLIEVHPNIIDAGDIINQVKVQLSPHDTYLSLVEKLGQIGGELLVDTIRNYDELKVKTMKVDICNS